MTLRNPKRVNLIDANGGELNWIHRNLKNYSQNLGNAGPCLKTHYIDLHGGSQHISAVSLSQVNQPSSGPSSSCKDHVCSGDRCLHTATLLRGSLSAVAALPLVNNNSINKMHSITNSQEILIAALLHSQQLLPTLSHFRDTASVKGPTTGKQGTIQLAHEPELLLPHLIGLQARPKPFTAVLSCNLEIKFTWL